MKLPITVDYGKAIRDVLNSGKGRVLECNIEQTYSAFGGIPECVATVKIKVQSDWNPWNPSTEVLPSYAEHDRLQLLYKIDELEQKVITLKNQNEILTEDTENITHYKIQDLEKENKSLKDDILSIKAINSVLTRKVKELMNFLYGSMRSTPNKNLLTYPRQHADWRGIVKAGNNDE
jgi:hypothetical protein